jgi:hypothetical protein
MNRGTSKTVTYDRRGACRACGGPTWDKTAAQCHHCRHAELRLRVGPANREWGRFTSDAVGQGRDRARRRYPLGPCQRCGRPAIDRHHRDGNTHNIEPGNVEALCRRCHMIADGRMSALQRHSFKRGQHDHRRAGGPSSAVAQEKLFDLRAICVECHADAHQR